MAPRPRARASSLAGSDFELDISSALADTNFLSDDNDDFDDGETFSGPRVIKKPKLDPEEDIFKGIISAEGGDEGDDDDDDEEEFIAARQAAQNRKGSVVKGKGGKGRGGGFQAMGTLYSKSRCSYSGLMDWLGLNPTLLKAITRKGFSVPTPIQRKTIPVVLEGIDVVGMARTGSGKTAAFVIPMIEKLKAHSVKVGARALILSPSRELALQTLKVVKEFGKGTDLKCVLLVGGDSLEDQFSFMAGNPDIIIATPGRFLHLQVEMSLSLSSIQYAVFDEADRLFEMGFSSQLTEILHALPSTRQTLLFSATLPKSLVEFAQAGLQEPHLVRLDADSKISQDLESAFFSVKSSEKEGALLHILQEVIKVPKEDIIPSTLGDGENQQRKRRRLTSGGTELSSVSTIIFVATKHHVEYISRLLQLHSYPISYVYGSLDQVARRQQVDNFRSGETKILVVTDVAARGIDIPIIANVINYDFPPQPKVFIHRVGRTARAGKRGWAYSLVRAEDAPYLLDLQLFLGRKLIFAEEKKKENYDFAGDVIVGSLRRDAVEACVEKVNHFLDEDPELDSLRGVAVKGEKLYQKTKIAASVESIKRAKEVVAKKIWSVLHPLFKGEGDAYDMEKERAKMLARVSGFRPTETIFEIGQRGLNRNEAAEVMRRRRQKVKIGKRKRGEGDMDTDEDENEGQQEIASHTVDAGADNSDSDSDSGKNNGYNSDSEDPDMHEATEADLTSTFTTRRTRKLTSSTKKKLDPSTYQDTEHFMSYAPTHTSLAEERAYSVHNVDAPTSASAQFALAARTATFDLTTDDGQKGFAEPSRAKPQQRWDKKSKKYVSVANDEDGSKGKRMIIGESGQKIAASFRSGRFEKWKQDNRVARMPKIGENEAPRAGGPGGSGRPMGGKRGGRMFHSREKAPKEADKFRDDFERRKKRVQEARERTGGAVGAGGKAGAPGGRDLKSKEQIRREVKLNMRRREKSNRPSKKADERRPFKPKTGGMKSGGGGGKFGGAKGGKGRKRK